MKNPSKGIDPLEFLSSKGRCIKLEKRLLELRKDSAKAVAEQMALNSELKRITEEMEAQAQFYETLGELGHSILSNDGKMSKLYMRMLETTLETCKEVPETPEEFIEKCKSL